MDDKKPMDSNLTLDVQNDKLEELIDVYLNERTNENLNVLIQVIHGCRLLVPAMMNKDQKAVPMFIKGKNDMTFMPVYTSKEQIPAEPKSPAILNVPYEAVNAMAARPEVDIKGVVINPFTNNLVFQKELLKKIAEVDERRKNQPEAKAVKLTTEQYNALMRKQYEFGFLPKKFFLNGQEFVDELCQDKEEFIDRLFEESYQEKRLYPYLPEDFSVMAMDISEELLVVRVDFPENNMQVPSCHRVYFTWNPKKAQGRYFTIEKTKNNEVKLLGEMTSELKHESLSDAPVEGAELQEIIDLQKGTSGLTS